MGQTSSQLPPDATSDKEETSNNSAEIIPDSQPNYNTGLPSEQNSPLGRLGVKRKRTQTDRRDNVDGDVEEAADSDRTSISINGNSSQVIADSQQSRKRRRSDEAVRPAKI